MNTRLKVLEKRAAQSERAEFIVNYAPEQDAAGRYLHKDGTPFTDAETVEFRARNVILNWE